jgi:hypothetical protein
MSDSSIAIEKLQRIEELWEKLKGIRTSAPEYEPLVQQIAALSAEYQKHLEAARTPERVSNYGN